MEQCGTIRFCTFPRGCPPPQEMFAPDGGCSLRSACVPVYVKCASPVPCLPCSIAELYFQNPDDAMKKSMRACQRRYFGEVWNLVFGQLFPGGGGGGSGGSGEGGGGGGRISFDADADDGGIPTVQEAPTPEPEVTTAGGGGGEGVQEGGRRKYTISSRPVQNSVDPTTELTGLDVNRRQKTDDTAKPVKPRASFVG